MYPISKPSTTRQQSSLNMLNFSLRSFMPRSLVVLGGVSFALLSLPNGVNAFISLPVTRNGHGRETYPTHLMRRDTGTWEQMMNNNISGGGYYAQVQVGTPPQDVTLIVDTGSSDVWVLDTNADLCTSPLKQQQSQVGGCIETYNQNDSSTFELVDEGGFEIAYLSGESSTGDYIKEDFHIGGATIESLQIGLAKSTDINSGLIGVGFGEAVSAAEVYPNIMDEFKSQGLIAVKAYSLWLNDLSADQGSILFGGIDTEKFIGSLTSIPIVPTRGGNYYAFQIAMTALDLTSPSGQFDDVPIDSQPLPVILDSGTTLSYLPSDIVEGLYETLNAYDDVARTGVVFVSCSILDEYPDMQFTFTFGNTETGDKNAVKLHVSVREMILDNVREFLRQGYSLPPGVPFQDDDTCTLGLQAIDAEGGAASRGGSTISNLGLLGDTFLRSAYVVYDLDNKEIGLAQANVNATSSNVVELTDGIPIEGSGVTGVESQEAFATATSSNVLSLSTDATGGVTTVTSTEAPSDDNGNDENAASPMLRPEGIGFWAGCTAGTVLAFWSLVGASMVMI